MSCTLNALKYVRVKKLININLKGKQKIIGLDFSVPCILNGRSFLKLVLNMYPSCTVLGCCCYANDDDGGDDDNDEKLK